MKPFCWLHIYNDTMIHVCMMFMIVLRLGCSNLLLIPRLPAPAPASGVRGVTGSSRASTHQLIARPRTRRSSEHRDREAESTPGEKTEILAITAGV